MKYRHELYPMLSVEEALEKVLTMFHPLEAERAPVLETLGRVLAEDVIAPEDIPPHANTAMDGYAVQAADLAGAGPESPKRLRVIENLAAGYVASERVTPGTAIRIMTGAPMPEGADAVIPFEETHQEGEWVDCFAAMRVGENVRQAGEDVRAGECTLARGMRLRPQEIGMLAALGYGEVPVIRRPRVAILATGDELVDIGAPLLPGKIRNANSYSNAAQVLQYGGVPLILGIARDTVEDLTAKIRAGLAQGADLLITSGGVSVGDFDVVKKVLAAEGEISFWRVRMKPGKPLACGHITAEVDGAPRTVPLLGMPGNPVSTMVSFELFARPAILTMLGVQDVRKPTFEAILDEGLACKDERRHYLRVNITRRADGLHAALTGEQGSGILSSMVRANGLAIIPEDWDHAPAGARVQVLLFEAGLFTEGIE
ncbi:MAG TPA: molybdopterin molybdotransferase MoeA [Anaerolineae bacterium]|nr:molybdopterin molybdotransferase MoeA [Anaerolineae bacterium]HQH39809.1 molybdopterin molybdotransferase MoeA [Anaerolineae bacterium]